MMLRLQNYILNVVYTKGTTLYLADTLSRAYLPLNTEKSEIINALEAVDHTEALPVSHAHLEQIKRANETDPIMETLAETILSGWPNDKKDVDDNIRSYWDVRDQLTIQESLIFKGQQLVVPSSLRNDLMQVAHWYSRLPTPYP